MQNYVFKEEFLSNLPNEEDAQNLHIEREKISRGEGCFRIIFINAIIFTVIVLCALILKFAAPKTYLSIKTGYNTAVHTRDITFENIVSFFEKIGNFVFSDNNSSGGKDADLPANISENAYVLTSKICAVTKGTVTSNFGKRIHPIFRTQGYHTGIDIANKAGTPIVSAFSGSVYEVGNNSAYGNYVIMRHSDTLYTFYGHCESVKVKEQMNMRKGEVIAYMGSTGYSTGPHLHFEIRINSKSVDPAYVLRGNDKIVF